MKKKILGFVLSAAIMLGLCTSMGVEVKAAAFTTVTEFRLTTKADVFAGEESYWNTGQTGEVKFANGEKHKLNSSLDYKDYNKNIYIGCNIDVRINGDIIIGVNARQVIHDDLGMEGGMLTTDTKVYLNGVEFKLLDMEENAFSAGYEYDPSNTGIIYRLYNPADGDHVYTTDEADMKSKTASGWNLEPSPGVSVGRSGVPIYRIVNVATGENLFTSDDNEAYDLIASGAWRDFNNDGAPVFYGAKIGKGFYRLYNPNATTPKAAHHFTADPNEVKVLTTQQGWQVDNNGQPLFYLAQ